MPLSEHAAAVARMRAKVGGVEGLATVYAMEHAAARFGSGRLYEAVMTVVVSEMLLLIRHDQPQARPADVDMVTGDLLRDVENAVLVGGRAATVVVDGHYGFLRHIVGMGPVPSLRWLWCTVFALLWTLSAGNVEDGEFDAAARSIEKHVGGREFKLFGTLLLVLHRLFGILPMALQAHLARYMAL
jgi:hypothetical protein